MAKQTAQTRDDQAHAPVDFNLIKRQILALYLVQTPPKRIAEMLKISRATVYTVVHEESRRRRLDEEEEIIFLYREGKEIKEIASHLHLRLTIVQSRINQLIDADFLEPRPRRRLPHKPLGPTTISLWRQISDLYDLNTDRVQLVLALMRRRATLQEIGDVLGVTRQRAEQIQKKILAIHGPEVVGTPELLTLREVAENLGLTPHKLLWLAQEIGLSLPQGSCRNYLVPPEMIEHLQRAHIESQQGTCVICRKPFTKTNKRSLLCLSPKCRHTWHDQQRLRYMNSPPTESDLRGWHKNLFQLLQKTPVKKDEEWIGLSEACAVSGLSKMQLSWLATRRIVTTISSPKKQRRKSKTRYARSQVLLAGRVYQDFLETK